MDPLTIAIAALAVTGAGIVIAVVTFKEIRKWVGKKLSETRWLFWKAIQRIFVVRQPLPPIKEQGIWNLIKNQQFTTMHYPCQLDALAVASDEVKAHQTFIGNPDAEVENAFRKADYIAGKQVICIENS